jgi:surface protein
MGRSHWSFGMVPDSNSLIRGVSSAGTTGCTITNLYQGFYGCIGFTYIPNTDWTKNVTDMESLFDRGVSIPIPITCPTSPPSIIFPSTHFDTPLDNWNVSKVTNMSSMFLGQRYFRQNINTWNVSNVTDMSYMFLGCHYFNNPLNNWNVSKVELMNGMFKVAYRFNQPLNNWNVSKVTNMKGMFECALSFDQDLGSWNIGNVTDMINMFKNSGSLSIVNYSAILNGWASLPSVQSGVTLEGGVNGYNASASISRASLTNAPNNWSITDGGLQP